jgi:hypothetical protein
MIKIPQHIMGHFRGAPLILKKYWNSNLTTNIGERFRCDGEVPTRIVCEDIGLG